MLRDHLDEIVEKYKSGKTLQEIADEHSVSRQAVWAIMKSSGVSEGLTRKTANGRCHGCGKALKAGQAKSNTRPDEFCSPCARTHGHWQGANTHVTLSCVLCGTPKDYLKSRIQSQKKTRDLWKNVDVDAGERICQKCFLTRRPELYANGVVPRPGKGSLEDSVA